MLAKTSSILMTLVAAGLGSPCHLVSQGAPVRRAVHEITIPGEGPSYFFDRIGGLALAPSGELFILLPRQSLVVEFDPNGRFRGKWGKLGSGPGEMRWASDLGWRRDTLWVYDLALARVSLFSQGGAFIRSIPLPVSGQAYLLADGTVATIPQLVYSVGRPSGPQIVLRRFTERGKLLDTILQVPPTYRVLQYERGGQTTVGRQPFEDGPLIVGAADGSGFLVVRRETNASQFELSRISENGDTIYHRGYRFAPVRLSKTVLQLAVGDLAKQGPMDSDPGLLTRIENALYKPRNLPTVTDALIGQDSTVWLRRETTWGPNTRWTVVDHLGLVLFDLQLPTSFRPLAASMSTVVGVLPDTNDVPIVQRFRIRP